ncbi:hypothetical protein BC829DRAFT_413344 [Chytridium lagenaria]|nr:hypothetical protein BC829DRAFT_413344 [Chytridium lagenaria]
MKSSTNKVVKQQQKLDFSATKKFGQAKASAKNLSVTSKSKADDALHVTLSPKRRLGVKSDDVVVAARQPSEEVVVEEKPAWIQELLDDREALLDKFMAFDLNMTFGNMNGLSRLQRWNRAQKLGLNPPKDLGELFALKEVEKDQELRESIWYGRL